MLSYDQPFKEVVMRPISLAVTVVLACLLAGAAALAQPLNYRAHLSGAEEVPPADTRAQGQAIFQLSRDGTHVRFQLNVANIENVTQAHIHLAPAGVNGPVVVWLYPAAPPAVLIPGRSNGVLAAGVITEANLVGLLADQTLDDLIAEIETGNAYVNVHTSQFPPGEIRGQIR
jgi:hypothetical protein